MAKDKAPENQEPLPGQEQTEWSRYRVTKASIEEDAGDLAFGKLTITASARKGVSDLYGAICNKPDLSIKSTDGIRMEFGKITRLVITAGKKVDTIHAVATVKTAPHVEDLVGRAVQVEARQGELPTAGE